MQYIGRVGRFGTSTTDDRADAGSVRKVDGQKGVTSAAGSTGVGGFSFRGNGVWNFGPNFVGWERGVHS